MINISINTKNYGLKLLILVLFISTAAFIFIRTYEDAYMQQNDKIIAKPIDVQSYAEDAAKDSNEGLFFNKPASKPSNTNIIIYKSKRVLELYGDDILIGRFKIALGGVSKGHKLIKGDSKTPEGHYYICTKNDKSRFILFLGLSYPNAEDALHALNQNIIGQDDFNRVKYAIENKQCPPWNTPLGGTVGIHGGGNSSDWTLGCISLSDEDIKILGEYTPLHTPVQIFP